MKKILLIAAVAMTAFFTSCKKDEPTASLVDQLCSMFNQPVDQALETAKSLGYNAINQTKYGYQCLKNMSDSENFIDIMYDDENENRVINVNYGVRAATSDIVSQAKSLAEQTGQSRIVNNVTLTFLIGEVDEEEDITSYNNFLEKIGNTKENAEASWPGPAPTYAPIIALSVEIEEQEASIDYSISIGG